MDGNIAREIKSGEGALSSSDINQMFDYAAMVDGQAALGGPAHLSKIKHARYTFTSPVGAKANIANMRKAFTHDKLAGRISFEVFSAKGEQTVVRNMEQLAQEWLLE